MTDGLRTYRDAVVLMTGGGSGIGRALATALAARGALVVATDRHEESAVETAGAIASRGGRAEARALDVRDADAVAALVDDVFTRHGRLDYLFNNAGIGVGGEVLDCSLADWRYTVEVNLMGVVHGIQAAYPRMARQGFGHIVSTASIAGLMPAPITTAYAATKHAVVGLTRSLRIEAAPRGVRVSALCPGVIRTPILSGGRYGAVRLRVPMERQLATWERLRPMDPARFAERALDQVAANRERIIVPSWWKLVWWLDLLVPSLGSRLATLGFREMKRGLGPAD
ncbi:MAG: SDR family oxidoreductase [Deltaproteobacteria bacterium]|nr:SDR family oxidoreductase [Deltaproteobacteria bacterium]